MPPQDYSTLPLADLKEQVERRALIAQLKLTEALNYDLNWVDPREPLYDDPSFWSPMGGTIPGNLNNQARGEYLPVYLNALGLKEVRDQSRWLCAYNEFAINASTNRVSYIVGTGLKYRVVRRYDDPKTQQDDTGKQDEMTRHVQDVIDQFIDDNDWSELEREVVRRCDRDGECFLRFFARRHGLVVRVIEPEFVIEQSSDPANSFGVVTEPDDVQTVHGYMVATNPGYNNTPEFVPVHEILHIKQAEVDRAVKRGIPLFFPVKKNLERAEKLLRNMGVLAQVQSTYAVIRKHTGVSAGAIRNFADSLTDLQYQNSLTGRTDTVSQLKPGSILDTTANTEYEFPSAGVNASAYVAIIDADLQAVASRLTMPSYMLTSKSDGINFASSLVAEAPSTKNFEALQHYFARKFGRGGFRRTQHQPVMWRVIVMAVRMGMLPREVLKQCEIQVECPKLVERDRGSETNRLATLNQAGVLSKATWAQLEDLDYEQEKRNGAKDEEDKQGPGGPPGMPGADGGEDGAPPQDDGEDAGASDDDPTDEELDALLAQLRQSNANGEGGGMPSQETVAGEQRPKTGLEGMAPKRPGTVTEAAVVPVPVVEAVPVPVVEAVPVPLPEPVTPTPTTAGVVPHRKTQEIARDDEGNIARIVTTIEPLAESLTEATDDTNTSTEDATP